MSAFKHRPLTPSALTIRLVELLPAENGEDAINLKLREAALSSLPKYTALSYTWGAPYDGMLPEWDDASSTKTIYIDHQEFQVRWNLHSALLHLRLFKPHELFWIDSICIDQCNVSERNSQVDHMRHIYRNAQETIMWLGPASASTEVAMERMTRFYTSLSKSSQEAIRHHNFLDSDARASLAGTSLRYDILNSVELCSAITTIFDSRYFSRAWILQEIICSPNPTAICGDWSTPWASMLATCEFVTFDNQQVADRINLLASRASLLIGIRKVIQPGGTGLMKLLDIVVMSRLSKATDSRDKIYAMLGIVEDVGLPFPDYSLHISQVFSTFAKFYVEHTRTYSILGYCEGPRSNLNLPSWVPDWTVRGGPRRIEPYWNNHEKDVYNPSPGSASTFRFLEGTKNGILSLAVRGFIADQLSTLGQPNEWSGQYGWTQSSAPVETEWTHMLKASYNLGRADMGTEDPQTTYIYNPTQEPLQRAIDETLYADVGAYRGKIGRISKEQQLYDDYVTNGWKEWSFVHTVTVNRNISISGKGYMGLVPAEAQVGDSISIFLGGTLPYLLRPKGDGTYLFIGECYVHGLMDGEAMKMLDSGEAQLEEIVLS